DRRATKHRFHQHEAKGFGILERIEQRARAAKQSVAFLAGDEARIFDLLSVYERLDFVAEVRTRRPREHETLPQTSRGFDGVQGAFAGNETPEVKQIVPRLFAKGELRRVHAMWNHRRWFQMWKRAPLMAREGGDARLRRGGPQLRRVIVRNDM